MYRWLTVNFCCTAEWLILVYTLSRSFLVYHRIVNVIPCVVQQGLRLCILHIIVCMLPVPDSQSSCPSLTTSLFCESVSVSRVCSFVSFWGLFFSFFGCATQHAGPCLSGQGWCPYPLRWKHRPLTTGLHRGGPFVDIFFPFIDFLRMAILTGVYVYIYIYIYI